jgi:hypothetical protein
MLAYAAYIAVIAVVYAVILVQPGMLLGTLYQRLQEWTLSEFDKYPEDVVFLKPLISCVKCVAGQWAFWAYPFLYLDAYSFFEHITFTALTIYFSTILTKLYQWTTQP